MGKGLLEIWVKRIVRKRWERENSEFLKREGFARNILKHPKKIPATQPGDYPGSAISYDKNFPSKLVPKILSIAVNREEAERYIDKIFGRIERGSRQVADGDHHSPDYGKPVYPQWYINTEKALDLAQNPSQLRELLYGKPQITSFCSPESPFRDEHGIERTVEDSESSGMTDHHGREFPFH